MMWRWVVSAIGVILLLPMTGVAAATNEGKPSALPKHYVFAHYMVCFAAYGERVEDYKREIQEAQAAGIDGFALNCGAWHNEPHYPRRTKAIYAPLKNWEPGSSPFSPLTSPG